MQDNSKVKLHMNNIINNSPFGISSEQIKITGNNNLIYIGENCKATNFSLELSSSFNKVYICNNVKISGKVIMKIHNNKLIIGSNTSIGNANFIIGEGTNIYIGKNCMIAWGIEFRTTDSHAIFDINSHNRVNYAKSIFIGNHVWVAAKATLLGGTYISTGSIVGYGSVVKKKFIDKNIIIAGNPAYVIKHNIYWDRTLLG